MASMNRKFDLSDKKTKFIREHLLSDLMNRIESSSDSEDTVNMIASMYIFPYRTSEGICLGSLLESGVSWYFAKDDNDKTVSTESYRIFADSVLTKEQAKKFRQTFSETGHVTEFSIAAVIKDILKKMSKETDYTVRWWSYAYDLLKLWNPEKFNESLSLATNSIDNNFFFFVDGYCDSNLKKELIKHNVFRDIVTPISEQHFWNKLQVSEKKKAIDMLSNMGVPNRFIYYENECYGVMEKHIGISKFILEFICSISDDVEFPVDEDDDAFEICELCHRLVTEIISAESLNAFLSTVKNENIAYSDGIVLQNVKGQFVPISWDLFYDSEDFKDKEEIAFDEEDENQTEPHFFEGGFESLHIDGKKYYNIILNLSNIHAFSDVNEPIESYSFGICGTEVDFYKWLWNYTQHEELVENILYYFSGDNEDRETILERDRDFVLTILRRSEVDDRGYCFDIDFNETELFDHASTVNRIGHNFDGIYVVVDCVCEKFEVDQYISRITNETNLDLTKKSEVLISEIWQHVYLMTNLAGRYSGEYVIAMKYDAEEYEEAIFLCPADDENSYIRALAKFIQDKYNTTVAIGDAVSFDWKNEYLRLIRDIRTFITDKHDVKALEDVFGHIAEMDDISDFGEEKRVWLNLRDYRERIVSYELGGDPVNFDGWRDFLAAKYKGRCQLCGGKIAMEEQKSYFWTFRMVKESDNRLANLKSNLFCLCPACHGEMRYGNYMGKDMTQIVEKAQKYAKDIEEKLKDDFEDDFPCLIQELVDENIEVEGFYKPIVCDVIVNGGEPRHMAFSWEHFMRIAFIFSSLNDYNEDEIYDDVESIDEFMDN